MSLTYIEGNDYSEGYYYGYQKAIKEKNKQIEELKDELHKWWDENPSYDNLKIELGIWEKIDKVFEVKKE